MCITYIVIMRFVRMLRKHWTAAVLDMHGILFPLFFLSGSFSCFNNNFTQFCTSKIVGIIGAVGAAGAGLCVFFPCVFSRWTILYCLLNWSRFSSFCFGLISYLTEFAISSLLFLPFEYANAIFPLNHKNRSNKCRTSANIIRAHQSRQFVM